MIGKPISIQGLYCLDATSTQLLKENQKTHADNLTSFDFTIDTKLVVRPELLQLCLIIVVIWSQDVFPSITEAQILDDDATCSFLTDSAATLFSLTDRDDF